MKKKIERKHGTCVVPKNEREGGMQVYAVSYDYSRRERGRAINATVRSQRKGGGNLSRKGATKLTGSEGKVLEA